MRLVPTCDVCAPVRSRTRVKKDYLLCVQCTMYTKDDAKANKQVHSLCVYANGRAKNYFCFICTACCCCCLFSICIHLLFLFRILGLLRSPIIAFVCLSHSISSCTQSKMPKNRNFSYMRSQHQHIHTYTSSNNTTIFNCTTRIALIYIRFVRSVRWRHSTRAVFFPHHQKFQSSHDSNCLDNFVFYLFKYFILLIIVL